MINAIRRMKLALCFGLALILLLVSTAPAAYAAVFELPVTIKAAFDKMAAAADQTTSSKLKTGYSSLIAVQKQDIEWDDKINALHYSNEEKLITVKQRMKSIDAAKIAKLEEEVKKTEEKYKPLFALHDSLTKQLSRAKSAKNKTLTAMLQSQTDASKLAVKIAKDNIKSKKDALKDAKTAASIKSKAIKATLTEVDKLKVKIKAAKSSVSSIKKQFTAETNTLKTAVRNSDSSSSLKSLNRLSGYMTQIIEQKKKIHGYETEISAIIAKANKQF